MLQSLMIVRCRLMALNLLGVFIVEAHADTSVWIYKGARVELIDAGGNVTIHFASVSVAFDNTGAQIGNVIFRGQRAGSRLTGTAYKFYGQRCGAIGFPVEGSIRDGERITLQGIAPGLGLNSCAQETTYYDTLLFTAAAPGQTQTAATVTLPPPSQQSVFLLFPFLCSIENGKPVLKKTGDAYYHEALDYRPPRAYSICGPDRGEWGESLLGPCRSVELTSLRLVCRGGTASAPELSLIIDNPRARNTRIDGNSLLYPIFNRFREADAPSAFHRLPAGFGIIPAPQNTFAAKSFAILYESRRIPVKGEPAQTLPQSFFLSLADAAPWPQLIAFPLLIAAAFFAAFGFSLYPESKLRPQHYLFWLWLLLAALGLDASLTVGQSIKDAYAAGHREAAAIAGDQVRLQALFPTENGHFLPFTRKDIELAQTLMQPRVIPDAAAAAQSAFLRALLYLLPFLAFLAVYARFIYAGYHYLLVRHPAEAVTATALASGELFDKAALIASLKGDPQELVAQPPVERSWNLLRRARLLRERILADADLAEAALRRDRARALQKEAEREWKEARMKLPWWQRLLGS